MERMQNRMASILQCRGIPVKNRIFPSAPLRTRTGQKQRTVGQGVVHCLQDGDHKTEQKSDKKDSELSGDVVVYGSAVFLTFGTFFVWYLFRDPIEDLIYGDGTAISLGDVSAVVLWTVAYYFASPYQLLLVFLGRFERERPSDWILYRLGALSNQPVNDASYTPPVSLYILTLVSIFFMAVLTSAVLKTAFGDATWSVSTGIGACMAAGVFEISRPQRLSISEKSVLNQQFADFKQFAEARLQQSGACHESEIFNAFRTEVPGYRNKDDPTDLTLRQFLKQWAPQSKRTSNGFIKKVSLTPRTDPFL